MATIHRSFTLDEALATVAKLEALLSEFGVKVRTGSGIERAFLATAGWEYEGRSPSGTLDDARPDLRDVLGAVDLAANLFSVRTHPSFDALVGHLALLATADPSTLPVTRYSAVDCQLFELVVACWAMRAGALVSLELPAGGKKTTPNPDVVATLRELVVGIACKAPNSASSETYYQRLKEGASQTLRRAADGGRLVVLNARGRIPFDGLQPTTGTFNSSTDVPRYGAFLDPDESGRVLSSAMEELNRELATLHESDVRNEPSSPMSRIDGWLTSAHVPTAIVANGLRIVHGRRERSDGFVHSSAKHAFTVRLLPADPQVHIFLDQLAVEANRHLVGADGAVSLA